MSVDHLEGWSIEKQRAELALWLPRADNVACAFIGGHREQLKALSLQRLDEGQSVYGDSSFWKTSRLLHREMLEEAADLFTYAALWKRAVAVEVPA